MSPIELRAETSFAQALRCVERRMPGLHELRPPGHLLALGLRYGLVGAAALHHLLLSTGDQDQPQALAMVAAWPTMVKSHAQCVILPRLPYPADPTTGVLLTDYAQRPVRAFIPLYRMLCPLDRCLRIASQEFIEHHGGTIRRDWSWYRWRAARHAFEAEAHRSLTFALNFFERRQAGLEEVPEIALLGE